MKLASGTTARANVEWIGATPDAKIPDRVRLRVFDRYGGKCYLTGKRLMPGEWDIEHVKSLKSGGKHRESNFAPAWRPVHREKTAAENVENGKINRKRKKHLLPKTKSNWPTRRMKSDWEPRVKYIERDFDT